MSTMAQRNKIVSLAAEAATKIINNAADMAEKAEGVRGYVPSVRAFLKRPDQEGFPIVSVEGGIATAWWSEEDNRWLLGHSGINPDGSMFMCPHNESEDCPEGQEIPFAEAMAHELVKFAAEGELMKFLEAMNGRQDVPQMAAWNGPTAEA